MKHLFTRFAAWTAYWTGTPYAFALALFGVLAWLSFGPFVGFGNTLYQLVVNTVTTVITFLMIFLLQHATTRDTRAILVKLDELIRVSHKARNEFLDVEDMEEDQLADLQRRMQTLGKKADEHTRLTMGGHTSER